VHANSDLVDQARLLASCSPGSADWLHALPISYVGLKMDNATVRIFAGFRLGAPVVRPHSCVCGTTVTAAGHHGLSCRHSSGRHSRHNQINDLLCRAFTSYGTLSTREPHSLCTTGGKHPDGVTLVPWKSGRCLACSCSSHLIFYVLPSHFIFMEPMVMSILIIVTSCSFPVKFD